jgi:hypothetical protein
MITNIRRLENAMRGVKPTHATILKEQGFSIESSFVCSIIQTGNLISIFKHICGQSIHSNSLEYIGFSLKDPEVSEVLKILTEINCLTSWEGEAVKNKYERDDTPDEINMSMN